MLAAARSGDEKAFMALVSPVAPGLQRLANRYSRNTADADDICQESLMKAYVKLEQFSGSEEFATHEFQSWLMKIAANSAIDFIRRKHGNRLVPLDECNHVPEEHRAGAGGWGEDPERAYGRREQREQIMKAITSLPVALRQVCLLRNVMEFSTKEAADRLGISTTAVRLRLFRAHSQLRKRWGDAAGGQRRNGEAFGKRRERARRDNSGGRRSCVGIFAGYSASESCAYGD
jgi:RNA polymerase sigma-70 factor (ECF subfamily)